MEQADLQPQIVVLAVMSNMTALTELRAEGLPEPARQAIMDIGLGWKNQSKAIRELQDVRRQHNLPPLAIWYLNKNNTTEPPPAVEVPFEPLELDESRSPLDELVPGQKDDETRRANAFRRGLVRVGLPLAILLPQVLNGGIQLLVNPTRFTMLLWGAIWGILALVFLMLWWAADDWFIVPGGIVVRRSIWRRVGQKLDLYRPQDTTLIIRMNPPGFAIEVWRDGFGKQRKATQLEVLAALGAWQSTQPAPSRERLSDLLSSSS